MSMIIAEPRRFPLSGAWPRHFAAHRVAVHAADVLRVADGEADLLALEAAIGDRRLTERAGEHLEVLLEAQRVRAEPPAAAHLRRRVVEVRGAPIGAVAARLLGDVGRRLRQLRSEEHTSELQSPYVISYA